MSFGLQGLNLVNNGENHYQPQLVNRRISGCHAWVSMEVSKLGYNLRIRDVSNLPL